MRKLTFGELIKHIQSLPPQTRYSIPADIMAHAQYIKTREDARRELAMFDLHYQKQEMETVYSISEPFKSTFWDQDTCRQMTGEICSIYPFNDKIAEFAKQMRGWGD